MPSSYTWPLTSPPAPSPAPGDAVAPFLGGAGGRPRRGLLIPFRRGPADFVTGEGLALISCHIQQIIGTRRSSANTQGELPWRTDFGSLVEHARHRNNDLVLEALLYQWVVDALARWLVNVRVTRTEIARVKDSDGNETILLLKVFWEVVARGGQVMGSGSTSVPLTAIGRA